MRAAIAVAVTVSHAGCSFVLMQSPPSREELKPNIEPSCSKNPVLPAYDLASAPAYAVLGLLLTGETSTGNDNGDAYFYGGVIAGVLSIVSGVVGFVRVRQCRDIKNEWMAQQLAGWPSSPVAPTGIWPVPEPPDGPVPTGPAMPGSERGRCRAVAPLCAGDLVCASDYCVRPPKPPGARRGVCRATDPTCDPGLTCASNACVEAPSGDGSERGHCRAVEPSCDPGLTCASTFCVRPPSL